MKHRIRYEKATPCENFWRTLACGVPIAVILFLTLPWLFERLAQ